MVEICCSQDAFIPNEGTQSTQLTAILICDRGERGILAMHGVTLNHLWKKNLHFFLPLVILRQPGIYPLYRDLQKKGLWKRDAPLLLCRGILSTPMYYFRKRRASCSSLSSIELTVMLPSATEVSDESLKAISHDLS